MCTFAVHDDDLVGAAQSAGENVVVASRCREQIGIHPVASGRGQDGPECTLLEVPRWRETFDPIPLRPPTTATATVQKATDLRQKCNLLYRTNDEI